VMRYWAKFIMAAVLLVGAASAFAKRPNILFVLVDDQRNDSLGSAGHPVIQTPHIDRLAKQGVRFENAFVTTSICMASRASIFTRLTETGHGFTGAGDPAIPVIPADVDTSFPVLLREAGYRTGFFGKQPLLLNGVIARSTSSPFLC
jgi:arylsulfatase A-like enzyme